jgi:hypothetical protein
VTGAPAFLEVHHSSHATRRYADYPARLRIVVVKPAHVRGERLGVIPVLNQPSQPPTHTWMAPLARIPADASKLERGDSCPP